MFQDAQVAEPFQNTKVDRTVEAAFKDLSPGFLTHSQLNFIHTHTVSHHVVYYLEADLSILFYFKIFQYVSLKGNNFFPKLNCYRSLCE